MARRTAIMSCKHMMDGTGWFHYAKFHVLCNRPFLPLKTS